MKLDVSGSDSRSVLGFGKKKKVFILLGNFTKCVWLILCHLQAILHAVCSTLINLQDNGAKFHFFITNLRFSFDSPSYLRQ